MPFIVSYLVSFIVYLTLHGRYLSLFRVRTTWHTTHLCIFFFVKHCFAFQNPSHHLGLARSFYSWLENVACNISDENFFQLVEEYKRRQRIKPGDSFHNSIFLPFPVNRTKGLISELEKEENEESPCYFELPGEHLRVPYQISGARRSTDLVVIKLTRQGMKTKDYFLCVDNRPLNNLADLTLHGFTSGQVQTECKAYYRALRHMVKNNEHCAQRFQLLAFKGKLGFF